MSATLVSMNLDGNEEREVAKGEVVTEFAVSPDGDWLAFVEGYQAFVAPLPRTGKRVDLGPKAESLPLRQLDVARRRVPALVRRQPQDPLLARRPAVHRAGSRTASASSPGAPRRAAEAAPSTGRRSASARKRTSRARAGRSRGARIVTMRGDEVIDDGVVVVRDNRIAAIGRRGERRGRPPAPRRVDVAGKTIMPGLVDAHWHGAMGEDEMIPQQSWVDYASLAFGVTTLHDPSNDTSEIFTHTELQRAGQLVAPAHLLDRHDPVRRQGLLHREGRQPGRRAHAPDAPEGGGRDLREELQPAAPRAAPADPGSGAPDAACWWCPRAARCSSST